MADISAIDASYGAFLWCELCGHVYSRAAWEAAGIRCPNCGASLANARPWDELRQLNPHYPETPVEGQEYALYG